MRVIEDLFISINRLKKEIKVLQQVIAYTKETLRLKKACILFVWLDWIWTIVILVIDSFLVTEGIDMVEGGNDIVS